MKIKEIFTLHQGHGYDLESMEKSHNSNVNFISRTSQNNGAVAQVEQIESTQPFQVGNITVALGGSVLSAFVQLKPFYTAFHIMVLKPKFEMTLKEKLYYCMCIKANAYRYSYGRQANKTLGDIYLPDVIPEWVYQTEVKPIATKIKRENMPLNIYKWKEFKIENLFKIKRGNRIVRDEDYFTEKSVEYRYNVITSTKRNNGVDGYYHSYNCPENSIVCGGEAGGMFTTYQPSDCWVMDRARIFAPKKDVPMNKYIGLFLATIFSYNQYKYSYGRTPNPRGIEQTVIKLPVTPQGSPDWDYMENYMKSLQYSDRI